MRIYHETEFHIPRISYFYRNINGRETQIKLVRNSLICYLTTKNETIIFRSTIYARDKTVSRKVFNRAVERMRELDRIGLFRYCLKVLGVDKKQ